MKRTPQNPDAYPDVLTVEQAAAITGKSCSTIRQLGIPGVKKMPGYGRSVRYYKPDVLRSMGITPEVTSKEYERLAEQLKRQQKEIDALKEALASMMQGVKLAADRLVQQGRSSGG